MITAPHGSWPSPFAASDVAAHSIGLGQTALVEGRAWWLETRPHEQGRSVVVREARDGGVEDVLPAPWSAHNRVHEYGGRSWLPVRTSAGVAVVFAEASDQRLYLLDPGCDTPVPLTPAPEEAAGDRYADLVVVGREVLCVRERHHDGTVRRSLVTVALDGTGVRELLRDGHFLASPRVSPDGRQLAWVTWEHPRMPWDGTELRVADLLSDGTVGAPHTVLGGPEESVLQPEWSDVGVLRFVSDRTGWWNLHQVEVAAGTVSAVAPVDAELAGPLWENGARWYAPLADGRLVCRFGVGTYRFGVVDPTAGTINELGLPWTPDDLDGGLDAEGNCFSVVATSSTDAASVVVVDAVTREVRVVRRAAAPLDPDWAPEPKSVRIGDGYGIVYAPRNPNAQAPAEDRPPYVVRVHGGPHSQARPNADPWVVFLTSRGLGVLDLDHRGSTGYGRAFREQLRGQWGVVDLEDAERAVSWLAEERGADPARIAITGQSAGGWTTLRATVASTAFGCAVSRYGIADLRALAMDTHDFESHYLDGLVGPWPEAEVRYLELSPLTHVERVACPVLLLQGEDDPVVPPNQAEVFAAALRARGIPHAVRLFPGESHGFRRQETIVAALETELAFYGAVFGFTPDGIAPLDLQRPAP